MHALFEHVPARPVPPQRPAPVRVELHERGVVEVRLLESKRLPTCSGPDLAGFSLVESARA
jgi:hypothetical protein